MGQPALKRLNGGQSRSAEEVFRRALELAVDALESSEIPYVLVGGVGSAALGRPRWTRDIDVLVAPVDADRTLDALARAGFDPERTNPHWIYKATMDDIVVDIIFRTVGDIYLDDQMIKHAMGAEFYGVPVRVASPEDQIVIKAIAHDAQSSRHWDDAPSLITSCEIDWDYLVERAARGARRVLSLLVYAQSSDLVVPSRPIEHLYEQIYHDSRGAHGSH
jgi:predicted nucleotidyltransferase